MGIHGHAHDHARDHHVHRGGCGGENGDDGGDDVYGDVPRWAVKSPLVLRHDAFDLKCDAVQYHELISLHALTLKGERGG